MDFKPLNDDHAVEVVHFRIAINRFIDGEDISALVAAHHKIQQDLPALQMGDEAEPTAEFAYRRPDGTASWMLRVGAGNQITVECRRYTRWAKIWAAAQPFFAFAIAVLHQRAPFECGHPTLTVVDRFEAISEQFKIDSLLRRDPLMADIIFDDSTAPGSPIFHTNTGWYDAYENELVLSTLNVAARRDPYVDRSSGDRTLRSSVVIEHLQQVRSTSGWPSDELTKNGLSVLDEHMDRLHLRNKRVIQRILSPAMADQINLEAKL